MSKKDAKVTRREFLAGAATMAALGASGFARSPESSKSLRQSAAEKGILYGSALRGAALKNPDYADLFASQCGVATPEGALKWGMLRPTPETYDFGGGDWLLAFSSKNGMKFRGHTLVWDGDLPPWFSSYANAGNAAPMMLDHISTVVRHYAGRVASWDVVNEGAGIEDGRTDGLRMTPWLRLIGPEYIDMAFHAAHEADPNAVLVYNESWLEPEDRSTETRRRAVLALLTNLRKRGVPVHALGVQSHIFAETRACGPNFERFLQEISDLGLDILVTEMDVRDQHLPGEIGVRDRMVAQQYYDYLSFMLRFKSVKTVVTWGLTDRYTWIGGHNPRPDGQSVRPLPYDEDLKPTLARSAMQLAFEQASER